MPHLQVLKTVVIGLTGLGLAGCTSGPDGVCSFENSPVTGLQVIAGTDAYFYADAEGGREVGYERLNGLLELEPGAYHARLNGSRHPVIIRSGQVTRSTAADIMVSGTSGEYYYVLDTVVTELAYERLGQPLSFFPGTYTAKLNNTVLPTDLPGGEATELSAGALVVTGTTDEYYYVLDTAGTELAYSRLGEPLAFFPGQYVAKVNNSTTGTEVGAEETTTVSTGTVVGRGTTDDYYYMLDTAGTEIGYARLGNPLAYLPGPYSIRVTNSAARMTVEPDQITEIVTGTVIVSGTGTDYYYVLDGQGEELGYNRLNDPTPLLERSYSVRRGDRTDPVTITAWETTTVRRED